MKYIYVFGRNPELSLQEIVSFLKSQRKEFKLLPSEKEIALIELEKPELKELGGTVKIAQVISEGNLKKALETIEETDFGTERKFYYSITFFGNTEERILQALKEKFKKEKSKAMLKNSANPSDLIKRRQLEEGIDFVFLEHEGKIFLGKTVQASNPLKWKERDLGRPKQKPILQTSIRLAKILVNLSMTEKGKTILDPFCGIGTIMQESLIQEYNCIGIDLDEENAEYARKNLSWLKEKYRVKGNFKVLNGDARKLSKILKKKDFQSVVSEPYLGPYIRGKLSLQESRKIVEGLERMYSEVFRELSKLMEKGQRIAIVLPKIRDEKVSEKTFLENGFKKKDVLKEFGMQGIPYLYRDEESKIDRLIYVLEKN